MILIDGDVNVDDADSDNADADADDADADDADDAICTRQRVPSSLGRSFLALQGALGGF